MWSDKHPVRDKFPGCEYESLFERNIWRCCAEVSSLLLLKLSSDGFESVEYVILMVDFGICTPQILLFLDDKCEATNIRCATNFRVANMNHYLSVISGDVVLRSALFCYWSWVVMALNPAPPYLTKICIKKPTPSYVKLLRWQQNCIFIICFAFLIWVFGAVLLSLRKVFLGKKIQIYFHA